MIADEKSMWGKVNVYFIVEENGMKIRTPSLRKRNETNYSNENGLKISFLVFESA